MEFRSHLAVEKGLISTGGVLAGFGTCGWTDAGSLRQPTDSDNDPQTPSDRLQEPAMSDPDACTAIGISPVGREAGPAGWTQSPGIALETT